MAPDPSFDAVEHFTAGTVGPRGQRTFYLQFGTSASLVTLKLEKQQVGALAHYLEEIMGTLESPSFDSVPLALDLIEPVEPLWAVGNIGAAYDSNMDRFSLSFEEFDDAEDQTDNPANAEVQITRGQVVAFVEKARQLVSAGRPPCRFCARPLDHDDGWCPCHN